MGNMKVESGNMKVESGKLRPSTGSGDATFSELRTFFTLRSAPTGEQNAAKDKSGP